MAKKINVKLIMELRDVGLSRNMIAATRHMSKNSVGDVIHIADQKGITFSDVRDLDEDAVYRMFYPDKFAVETLYAQPDYGYVHQELKRTGVTLKLLWQEYQDRCRADGGIPMGYTKFCEGYSSHTAANRLTNHLEHKPGIVTEVDWSGPTMHYVDTATGELVKVYLCHHPAGVRQFKDGRCLHPREGEVVLTADYEALGGYYMTAIMPAGVRKPKQKASVEGTVGKIATAIIAKLRNETFYSFSDLKSAVYRKLEEFNRQSFQKREGSRYDAFQEEKEYLHALPAVPYEIATWVYGRKVNLDYHVVFEYNRYSCPYQYLHKKVDLKVTDTTVEIYAGTDRIATHTRFPAGRKNQHSTHAQDMPDQFKFSPWDERRIRSWAESIGKYTGEVIGRIFGGVSIKEQGYNPSLAVLRLSNKYSEARLEAACEYAIVNGIKRPRYHHLNSILASNQDEIYLEQKNAREKNSAPVGYLRGSSYYGGGSDGQ